MLGILAPLSVAQITASSNAAQAVNMLTPSPREIWSSASGGTITIDIDFGAVVNFDTIFLGGTTLAVGQACSLFRASGWLTGYVSDMDASNVRLLGGDGTRFKGLIRRTSTTPTRYLRLLFINPAGVPLEIGVIVVGTLFTHPYAYGSGRIPIDTSRVSDLQDGGYGVDEGVVKSGFRWRFVDLSDAKRDQLWSLVSRRGVAKPVVVIENALQTAPADPSVIYGRFDKFEAWERANAVDTVWAMSMTEWR